MQKVELNKTHLQALFSLYNIDDYRARCIAQSYPRLELVVLSSVDDLKTLVEEVREVKDTFKAFVFENESYSRYVSQFENENQSATLANIAKILLLRSYFFYVLHFNKGIQSYILNDTGFKQDVVKLLYRITVVLAKRSMIALPHDKLSEVLTIVAAYAAYCLFGYNSLSEIVAFIKGLDIGLSTKTKLVLFYSLFKKLCDEGKNLAQILGALQDWPRVSIDTFYINASQLLGPTLTYILFVCNIGGSTLTLAFKMSQIYFVLETGQAYQEANIASVNRVTDFALNSIHKKLRKFMTMGHFGKC